MALVHLSPSIAMSTPSLVPLSLLLTTGLQMPNLEREEVCEGETETQKTRRREKEGD